MLSLRSSRHSAVVLFLLPSCQAKAEAEAKAKEEAKEEKAGEVKEEAAEVKEEEDGADAPTAKKASADGWMMAVWLGPTWPVGRG